MGVNANACEYVPVIQLKGRIRDVIPAHFIDIHRIMVESIINIGKPAATQVCVRYRSVDTDALELEDIIRTDPVFVGTGKQNVIGSVKGGYTTNEALCSDSGWHAICITNIESRHAVQVFSLETCL